MQVGGDKRLHAVVVCDDGAVVANAFQCRAVMGSDVFGETFDKSELSDF